MRGLSIVLLAAACAGCPGGPPSRPVPPDLEPARKLGRSIAAVEKYAELYAFAAADDSYVIERRAEILVALRELGAPAILAAADEAVRKRVLDRVPASSDRDLVTAALADSARAMAKTVDAPQHISCSARQAALLRAKITTPALRQSPVKDEFEELLYRRLLLEAVAAYETFALVRTPAGHARSGDRAAASLDELAGAFKALADHPATVPAAVKYWDDLSLQVTTTALQVRSRPDQVRMESEARGIAEFDVDRHLAEAARAHDDAVRFIANNEAIPLRLRALEDALRHWTIAREAILVPTARHQDAFQTARIDDDQIRAHALKR